MDLGFIAGIIASCLILGSLFFAMRFYPPGEGYDSERRNNRIALVMFAAGLAFIVGGHMMF